MTGKIPTRVSKAMHYLFRDDILEEGESSYGAIAEVLLQLRKDSPEQVLVIRAGQTEAQELKKTYAMILFMATLLATQESHTITVLVSNPWIAKTVLAAVRRMVEKLANSFDCSITGVNKNGDMYVETGSGEGSTEIHIFTVRRDNLRGIGSKGDGTVVFWDLDRLQPLCASSLSDLFFNFLAVPDTVVVSFFTEAIELRSTCEETNYALVVGEEETKDDYKADDFPDFASWKKELDEISVPVWK